MKVAVPQATVSWEAAHAAVEAAVREAESLGVRINVAVADAGGNLIAFLRMPGAFPQSISIAIDKAYTAGGFGFPTGKWMDVCANNEGMKLGFWRIAMRPGKPLMFGRLDGTRCLGLPGNPVASLVCSQLFLKPLLARLGGRPFRQDMREARLGTAMAANDRRQDFVRAVVVTEDEGTLVATPFGTQDSSMLKMMADANGLIIREPFAPVAEEGTACRVLMLR